MIDRLIIRPHQVYLTQEARGKVKYFARGHFTKDLDAGGRVIQTFKIDRYGPVKIVGTMTRDNRFWVTSIEVVLPALLHGHNGRSLRTIQELWLALTILQHIVRRVTQPEGHERIIPGIGKRNLGFLDLVECSVTVRDPGQLFLHGSHLARLKYQQHAIGLYPGERTKLSTREVVISIYDKPKEMGKEFRASSGGGTTRVEAAVRSELRLAKEVRATKLYDGEVGEVVATLAPETSLAVLRSQLMRMTGFGWGPGEGSLDTLHPKARIIACALGDLVVDARRLNMALAAYRQNEKPNGNTFRQIDRDLRAYAARTVIPDPMAIIPRELADVQWADVQWFAREMTWNGLMREIGAPTEPDPAIAAAWSQTTMLREKPVPGELTGPVSRHQLPFLIDPTIP